MVKEMFREFSKLCLIGFLSAGLVSSGCTSIATIKKPDYQPFLANKPVSDETLQKIKSESPKDAVFADLLQAFALMRSGKIEDLKTRKEITSLLSGAVSSFEDMKGPVNISKAFSVDEEKEFRGGPHERMFASAMMGVFLMADNKCDQALPYLRNAEFLDARFQKMPFGTDAPLIYALMYRCLNQQGSDAAEIKRAADGVFRSIRFLTWQEPLIEALVDLDKADIRPMALSNRLAYMIFEVSIYHSLISASNDLSVDALIDDASHNASLFISTLDSHFEDEYKNKMKPAINELSPIYGLNKKDGFKYLENLAFERVSLDVKTISDHMKQVVSKLNSFQNKIKDATERSKKLTEQILKSARADKLALNFSGQGPKLVREGSYSEISVVKPSPDGSILPVVREKKITTNTACGFHRTEQGGFSVIMCKDGAQINSSTHMESLNSVELLSLSRKATTAGGRKFDKILKGRAQFRAATEDIATVSAWSAFFLFYMGSAIMSDCNRRGGQQSCYAPGYALWAIAGITVLFSGTVWLIGRSSNPAADSRYIPGMYESTWLAI
jgi:hypothetical protein